VSVKVVKTVALVQDYVGEIELWLICWVGI